MPKSADRAVTTDVRMLRRAAWAQQIESALLLALILYLLISRNDARKYYNDQLHQLACTSTSAAVRAQYRCDPPPSTATPTPRPASTAPRPRAAEAAPDAPTAPPQRQRTSVRVSGTATPPRSSQGRSAPRPARTVTSTATGPTVTATAAPPPGVLPNLICTVLGCRPTNGATP